MRSDTVKAGPDRAPHRGLLKACGVTDADMAKPFIGIANSYTDIVPGHVHLKKFAEVVKAAVRKAGGMPFEFNTIAVDDGIAMGHLGMRYSLPSRELIADAVETMVQAHCFDAMICISNCDKITPGMLLAAVRVNIPTIFITGGPMKAGQLPEGGSADLITIFEGRRQIADRRNLRRAAETAGGHRLPDLRLLLGHVHGQLDELSAGSHRHGVARQRHDPRRRSAPQETGARCGPADHETGGEEHLSPRHRHGEVARQRVCARHGHGRLDQYGVAHVRPRARGRRGLSVGTAQRSLGAHPLHLQGLRPRNRTCTSRTWTARAASAPS